MEQSKYSQINWVKGMKLTEQVFSHADAFWIYQLNQLRSLLSRQSYGLFPQIDGNNFVLQSEVKSNRLFVQRLICKAITPAGYFIDINTDYALEDEADNPEAYCEIPIEGENLDLYIYVNPFNMVATGKVNPTDPCEIKPYREPQYELRLTASDYKADFRPENACLIAKYKKRSLHLIQVENFIPPCIAISSHSGLRTICGEFQQQLVGFYEQLLEKKQKSNQKELIYSLLTGILPLRIEIENDFERRSPSDLFVLMKKAVSSFILAKKITSYKEEESEFLYNFHKRQYDTEDLYNILTAGIEIVGRMQKEVRNLEDLIIEEPAPAPEPEKRVRNPRTYII